MNLDRTEIKLSIDRGKKDIVFFAHAFLGLKLHPGQIRFLREANGIVNILVPGNRYGKTVLLAVRHIWHNFYKIGLSEGDDASWTKAGYQTACLGPFGEVLEVDFRIIKQIMTSSFVISREGEPIRTNDCRIAWFLVPEACRNSPPYFIQFKDNSSIRFFSGSEDKFGSVQGKKFGYGSYDEGGRSHHLEYELKSNLIPRFQEMAAPLDLASTPDQRSPSLIYHHEIFQKGMRREDGFVSFKGSARENVYLPESYFRGIELSLGDDPIKAQVIEGEFVFAGDTLYNAEDIDRSLTDELNGGERYTKGKRYVIATDTAIGEDEQVYSVLDAPPNFDIDNPNGPKLRLVRQVAFKGSSKSPQLAMQDYIDLWEAYDRQEAHPLGILETFSEGSVRWYYDLPDNIRRRTKAYGSALQPKNPVGKQVKGNGGKKVDMLIALRKVLAAGLLLLPSDNKELIQQLKMYREDDKNLKTDRVISLALAVWMVLEGKPANPVVRAVAINW